VLYNRCIVYTVDACILAAVPFVIRKSGNCRCSIPIRCIIIKWSIKNYFMPARSASGWAGI